MELNKEQGKYQTMPPHNTQELDALRESIKTHGVMDAIVVDENGVIIDGHTRYAIVQELNDQLEEGADKITFDITVKAGLTEAEKLTWSRTYNLTRRHLTQEQRREQIKEQLKLTPELSNRQIASTLSVDHKTVGEQRSKLEATGEIPQLDTTVGADGKVRKKPVTLFNPTARETQALLHEGVIETMQAKGYTSPIKTKSRLNKEKKAARQDRSGIIINAKDIRLIHADIRELYPMIPDESIDLVLTDAPYEKEYIKIHESLSAVSQRVLVDGGSLLCAVGINWLDTVLFEITSHMRYFHLLAVLTPGASAKNMDKRVSHNYLPVVWCTKGRPRHTINLEDTEDGKDRKTWHKDVYNSPPYGDSDDKAYFKHGKNLEVYENFVKDFSLPGETILEPFCGGGTTVIAAIYNHRRVIACDINLEHLQITQRRIRDEFDMDIPIESFIAADK